MDILKNPLKSDWPALTTRPSSENPDVDKAVSDILRRIRETGDKALFELTERFDGVALDSLKVNKEEILEAEDLVSEELKAAIRQAAENIRTFHSSQVSEERKIETMEGVTCWRKSVGIEKVGLYVPGGSAPLFSTVLMLGIPAQLAGCKEVILCTPVGMDGKINPAILFAAHLVGITQLFKVGGAQAVAAMSFGTITIPKVDKVFGPGNQFVTKAKEMVQLQGTAIDMPAGPSEVLVIADDTAVPQFVAADLLSQAEHGPDSQVILVTTSETLLNETKQELTRQLTDLSRKGIAEKALINSRAILFDNLTICMEFSNAYAPEHLILAVDQPENLAQAVINAGSVFLGNYSCESAGDYASGTNHTLPTAGFARNFSGVSVDSFVKKITFQQLTAKGIQNIGETVEIMATAEGLDAHKNAVSVRLNSLQK